MQPAPATPDAALNQARVIVGALILGLLAFTAVSVFVNLSQGPFVNDPALRNVLLAAAGAVILGTAAVSIIIPNTLARQAGRHAAAAPTADDGMTTLAGAYTQTVIIRGALAEGPTLFCIVIFLLTGFWPVLAGLLIGLAHFALVFPTRGRFADFADRALGHT